MNLEAKLILKGKIEVKTGLHVGGSKETLDIGGMDNPIIRDRRGKIYIPGSSLKGKIRNLLENVDGRRDKDGNIKTDGTPCECGDCPICKIFGPHSSKKIKEPARIIVRDAYIEEKTETEDKIENTIDRVKGTALNPRHTERVPAGSIFSFEIVFNVYSREDKKLFEKFVEGMKLLEDDYLGGSGSRGYGKIEFKDLKVIERTKEFYEVGKAENKIESLDNIADLEIKLNELKSIS